MNSGAMYVVIEIAAINVIETETEKIFIFGREIHAFIIE
jgi:hypothetical protein